MLLPTIASAQKEFEITGTFDKEMDGKIIEMYIILPSYSKIRIPIKRTTIRNGTFSFKCNFQVFELYAFKIDQAVRNHSGVLFLLPKSAKIQFQDTLLKKFKIYDDGFRERFEEERNKISADLSENQLVQNIERIILQPFAGYFLFSYKDRISEAQILRLAGMIPERFRSNTWYTELKNVMSKFMIGKPAPDFQQNDQMGNAFRLSALRGKYVLLEFWASWCIPCRAENPNLVKTYKEFNKKGFEILSVSLDTNKDKWIEAIAEDKLIWKQVSDLKGWESSVNRGLFNVYQVPQNYLINPEGIIVAKNLYGDEISKTLIRLMR